MSGRDDGPGVGRELSHRIAAAIVWLRFLIIIGWIVAVALATLHLPSIFAAESGSLGSLLPSSSEAVAAEREALREFGLPLTTPVLAAATQADRLSPRQLKDAARYVAHVDERPFGRTGLRVLPLLDVPALAGPGGTDTLVTNLYLSGDLSERQREATAARFAAGLRRSTGVEQADLTGPVPAGWAQARIGNDHLIWLELATVAIVIAILVLFFRAPGVPFVGIVTVAIAYLLTNHVLGWAGERFGLSIPSEVDPVIIALLFGTLTDYVVFFVSAWRRLLMQGRASREAVVEVTAELLPVILTAALMIAGSILTLLISGVGFLTTFVPGMTIAVLIGASVAVTIIPAFLAVIGPVLLWPHGPGVAGEGSAAEPRAQSRLVGAAVAHPLVVSTLCVVALGAGATGVTRISLGDPVIRGLPSWSGPRQGYAAASRALGAGSSARPSSSSRRTGSPRAAVGSPICRWPWDAGRGSGWCSDRATIRSPGATASSSPPTATRRASRWSSMPLPVARGRRRSSRACAPGCPPCSRASGWAGSGPRSAATPRSPRNSANAPNAP
jgi:RND superfamily putative drug exporter